MANKLSSTPCIICGHEKFAWGYVRSVGTKDVTYNESESSVAGDFFGFNSQAVQARRCVNCGNLQLFVMSDA